MTAAPTDRDRRWLKRFGVPDPAVQTRLLCFHHAGGSATMFRHWPELLPVTIELVAVQLPGRADRFLESPYDRMAPLVDELVDVITPMLERPFACYGVSMGARVAWALAHTLRDRGLPLPTGLHLAASGGPSLDTGQWPWEGRAGGLESYVREMGGTPAAVLAEPVLLAALLPTLQADLTVLSTHGFQPDEPLPVPISAFVGADDTDSPPDRVAAWRRETSARFSIEVLPGGHFFDADTERRVVETVGWDLARSAPATAPPPGRRPDDVPDPLRSPAQRTGVSP